MLDLNSGPIELKLFTPGTNWMKIGSMLAIEFVGYFGKLPKGSHVSVNTGHPGRSALAGPAEIDAGNYHIGITSPTWILKTCNEGRGALGVGDKPARLRAIGTLPHHDMVVLAVRKDLGITSIRQLIEQRYPLRFSTSPLHLDHPLGWLFDLLFAEYGIGVEDFEKWGGAVIYGDRQPNFMEKVPEGTRDRVAAMQGGQLDAVFDEAIMTKAWKVISDTVELTYLPIDRDVLQVLEKKHGVRSTVLPKGYFRGVTEDIPTVEFGGWTIFCREDLPERLAYLTLHCLERQAAQIQGMLVPEQGLTGKIDLSTMWQAQDIPLHPGAAQYYREKGYME